MLFYTGANKHLAIQQDSSKSLGGWISSSQIPNDLLENIFSSIDYTTVKNNLKSNKVIAFLNNTGNTITEFSIYTETLEDSFSKFKIGLILNSIDSSCNYPYFEQLQSDQASPIYVTLQECEGIDNKLILANIPNGQYVGIFIQRELIESNNPDFGGVSKNCEQFNEDFINGNTEEILVKENIINLVINY